MRASDEEREGVVVEKERVNEMEIERGVIIRR